MQYKDKIENVAKRRGIFYISSEIYGGLKGFYDYGHIGTLIKNNWISLWRDYFTGLDDNFFEIDSAQIMPEPVFVASGHIKNFVDPVVKCSKCGHVERADHLINEFLEGEFEGLSESELTELIKRHNVKCPVCKGDLEDVGILNMMFPLNVGTGKNALRAFLRPETAQSAYVNFKRQFELQRRKLPLGLAIVGKAFRNEISPRNALIRQREFTQAELQIFFNPFKISEHERFKDVEDYVLRLYLVKNRDSGKISFMKAKDVVDELKLPEFYVYYLAKVQEFYYDVLGLPEDKIRFKELNEEERAFYNKYHFDIEVELKDLGYVEIGGVHYRTDHDLKGHQAVSKEKLSVKEDGKEFIPHVLELSFGVDRNVYSLVSLFYREGKDWSLFSFPVNLAPFKAGVFPLMKKDGLGEKAKEVYNLLKEKERRIFYDEAGSIGKRYARADEIGVPFAITIDHQTLKDNTFTLRFRDTKEQKRVKVEDVLDFFN